MDRRTFLEGLSGASGLVLAGTSAGSSENGGSPASPRLRHSASSAAAPKTEGPSPAPPDEQYKRLSLDPLAELAVGNVEAALEGFREAYHKYPMAPEFLYGLALTHGQMGEIDRAARYAERAVDHGLPFSRFQAGPRRLVDPLEGHAVYQELARTHGEPLVHGPTVGSVTDTEARFWVRTWHPANVQIALHPVGHSDAETRTEPVRSSPDRDYTAVAHARNLEPDTAYRYRVLLDGAQVAGPFRMRTFPPTGAPARFEIGFGGCAGYTPWHEHVWRTIASYRFPAFLLTGDNVYIDNPEIPAAQQYCYYRRQSRPEFREFARSTSVGAVWDDHDFGKNDSWGGPHVETPEWKRPVWETFRNNWNNPSYGGGADRPGCWFDLSIADVDVFMLDDRAYRTDPESDHPTMLGPDQKQWLYERLTRSTATFKLLVTSVPWAYGTKPGSLDPWQGYKDERAEIFSFLHAHRIEGVILLSGDRHRADVWRVPRESGYDFYEFQNGRLTNVHYHQTFPEKAEFSYNEKCTFGRLRFDTTLADPRVEYDIITLDDELIHTHEARRSEMSYG